jgi:FkbM family methyltransferase
MPRPLLSFLRRQRDRFIPAFGARLSDHPRLAATTLMVLRNVPGRRLRGAAYRHVARPLVSRLRVELDVPVAGGSRMRVATSEVTGRMLATSGIWEPHVTAVFRERLRSGDVCLDIGANVGYFTLLAARLVGPNGHVHAFEPEPSNAEQLAANVQSNQLANVTIHRVAVGVDAGTATLHQTRPASNPKAWTLVGRPDEQTAREGGAAPKLVTTATLVGVVRAADRDRIRLVKIDVDGAEVEVLASLGELFAAGACPDVVVELHPFMRKDVLESVVSFSRDRNLSMFEVVDQDVDNRSLAASRPVLLPLDSEDALNRPDPLITLLLTSAGRRWR